MLRLRNGQTVRHFWDNRTERDERGIDFRPRCRLSKTVVSGLVWICGWGGVE